MKARFLIPLAALALITICSCNHNIGNATIAKPLNCDVVPSEVFGGNYTAADLKFYRVVDSHDDVWNMYLRCVGELPEGIPAGISEDGRITSREADTAAFAEHARNICMKMCNDANEYIYGWQSLLSTEDTIYECLFLCSEPLPLDGNDVVEARALENEHFGWAEPLLDMTFNTEAAKRWEKITDENIGRRIAFVFAGKVISTPMVNCKIEGGKSCVSGLSEEETCALAKVLNQ